MTDELLEHFKYPVANIFMALYLDLHCKRIHMPFEST